MGFDANQEQSAAQEVCRVVSQGRDLAGDLRGVESHGGERRVAGASPPQGRREAEAQRQIEARSEVQDCSSEEGSPANAEAPLMVATDVASAETLVRAE